MENLKVVGGKKLKGKIKPSGNKNAALPIICATLLTEEEMTLKKVPDLTDVNKLVETLKTLGVQIEWNKETEEMKVNSSGLKTTLSKNLPIGMRGTTLLFSPLLYRMKNVTIKSEIGGCALGIRELDPHFEVLDSMGADLDIGDDINMRIDERFKGNSLWQDYASVTVTENFIMSAVLADGESEMVNAASEPHVQDLCNFLVSMGAKIEGIGSSTLKVTGVEKLSGTEFEISSDHHEITTLLALAAMTNGEIEVEDAIPEHFPLIIKAFSKFGVDVQYKGNTAYVKSNGKLKVVNPMTQNLLQKIEAAPWPYFPADLMPLMVALAVKSEGEVMFWNKLYEGGFFWIQEMNKFGAHIVMGDPHRIFVFGGKPTKPAQVDAPNIIRATVGLLMVALATEGESLIRGAGSIKRAHPHFVENLKSLGADIEWEE